jgi:pantoate--beta-alanine ligase
MKLFKKSADIQNYIVTHRKKKRRIGFVPTMGALHEGHITLVHTCKKENDVTICSIFINPKQFNDPHDYKKYPVALENDIYLLEKAGCDVLFLPSVNEIYPGSIDGKHYDLGHIETILEGYYRPGHFQGVCQVVHKLLDIVEPDQLYLGQKDYQQCMVIKTLIGLLGKSKEINVHISPTKREADGVAMSSRNLRLIKEDRQKAPAIYQALTNIKNNLKADNLKQIKESSKEMLTQKGFKVDYVEIADSTTLESINNWDGNRKLVALIAVYINDVRLIDNMLLD